MTESYLTGFYFKARVDFELLETYSSGLIALSGNHLGEISQHITTGKSDVYIKERLDYYTGLFGKDHFYLELIEHPDRGNQGKINDGCIRLSRTYGTPVVATNDVFYMTSEDAEAQDLLACISDGRSIEDPDRPTLIEGNYSLRSPDEMAELFSYIPEALKNTEKIAGMIHLEIPYGKTLIPTFELDSVAQASFEKYQSILPPATLRMDSEEWNLRSLCYSGLNRRYNYGLTDTELDVYIHKIDIGESVKRLSDMSLDELLERSKSYQTPEKRLLISKRTKKEQDTISRLEYELTVVDLMGFNGYFNIVADFINWAKNHDIPV